MCSELCIFGWLLKPNWPLNVFKCKDEEPYIEELFGDSKFTLDLDRMLSLSCCRFLNMSRRVLSSPSILFIWFRNCRLSDLNTYLPFICMFENRMTAFFSQSMSLNAIVNYLSEAFSGSMYTLPESSSVSSANWTTGFSFYRNANESLPII